MDRYILCLANSYKHGGRCIAGVEVTINNNNYSIVRDANGTPKWLRPISYNPAGEVPDSHAVNIRVLSIVKIIGAQYAGRHSHSEDVYYQSLSVHSNVKSTRNVLNSCVDNYHSTIFGNRGKALTPKCFQNGTYSVMLVHTKNPEVYIDTRFDTPKVRIKFIHNGNKYDFPITDPLFLNKVKYKHVCIGTLSDVFLVLSLGVEHEGWHSKLVAAIIETPEEFDQIAAPQLDINNKVPISITKQYAAIVYHQQAKGSGKGIETNPQTNHYTQKDDNSIFLSESQEKFKDTLLSSEKRSTSHDAIHVKVSDNMNPLPKSLTDNSNYESKHVLSVSSSTPKQKSEGCYIATVVYGSYDAPEVVILRNYRDTILKRSYWGRLFICIYYAVSPYIANKMKGHKRINKTVKMVLDKLVSIV